MDEFISVDEALEMLFDKTNMDDAQKLKRLFQYYRRGKVHFYVELLDSNGIYGKPIRTYKPKNLMDAVFTDIFVEAVDESIGSKMPEVKLLEGYFGLDRNFCGDYLKALLDNHYRPYTSFHECNSVVDFLDEDFQVWRMTNFADISCDHFSPELDDLLVSSKQITELTQSITPQKKPHNRFDIIDKSNRERMEILGAALAVLSEFRGECVTKTTGKVAGAKVAKLVDDKAQLFWPETLEPPQDKRSIEKIINEWLSKAR